MAKEMTERQKRALGAVPESRKGIVEKAYRGTASPRQAIKAKCYECVGYEDMSRGVRECSSSACPLWAFRPGAGGKARNGGCPETEEEPGE